MAARIVPPADVHIIRMSSAGNRLVSLHGFLDVAQKTLAQTAFERVCRKSLANEEPPPNGLALSPEQSVAYGNGNDLGKVGDFPNQTVKRIADIPKQPVHQRGVDRLFGFKVVVKGTEADVCDLGDLIDRDALHPLLRHSCERRFQKSRPGLSFSALAARLALSVICVGRQLAGLGHRGFLHCLVLWRPAAKTRTRRSWTGRAIALSAPGARNLR